MKYTKRAVNERLEEITYGDEQTANRRIHSFKLFIVFLAVLACLGAGAMGIGGLLGIIDNAPDIESLDFSPKGYATTTYNTKGELVATLVQEGSNREAVAFEEIPEDLINAFVAIEDQRFWTHNGIDLRSITRAVKGVLTGNSSAGGGSTLTQQLIKNNVFSGGNEKGFELYERKFQEWFIALSLENQPGIEKTEIKRKILTDYLNTINLGNNTLGVKVAADRYFGKPVSELDLAECSVLASITKNPSRLNPLTHPDNNQERRLQVLENMYEQGYISAEQRDGASGMEVYDRIQQHDESQSTDSGVYSYFTDALISQCIEAFQERLGLTEAEARNLLYSGGLKIMTTQDPDIQRIVDEEVNDPDNYDTAKLSFKWRCSVKHRDGTLTHYSERDIENYIKNEKGSSSYNGLYRTEEAVTQDIDEYKAVILKEEEGDEIIAETLDTTLQPQLSFVLMDQKTNEVKALTGGRGDKKYSLTINRASGAYRQPGSAFKVVAAFAPAIEENGATLATCYYDSEFTLGEKTFRNWWKAGNYFGYSSIREGIEFSMNIVAVRCMYETVTADGGIDFARRLGISSLTDDDRNVATALGGITKGVTNLELTNAYAAIADGGMYHEPKLFTVIYDHDGNVLIDMNEDEKRRVMKETTAFLLTDAMRGVVEPHTKWSSGFTVNNTSSRCRLDNMVAAGKSGTSTKNVDVWFVGYTPYYTAGVWGGCDDNQSLNDSSTGEYNGGTSFHKDIWRKIMNRVHEGLEPVESFKVPEGIVQVEVCRKSGMLPKEECFADIRGGTSAVYTEYFDADNVPTEYCENHLKGGGIRVPEEDAGKPTDDSAAAVQEPTEEETSVDNYDGIIIESRPAEVIMAPGIDISSQGPGGGA
ncbi:MAG: transglycosylase domain-containing protein [Clostridiales bacterium]|nr:transglycosylase domain-containing protein [Clostridiales bacterium]